MTVANQNSRMDYVGNNTTPTYSFTYQIFDNTDLVVTTRDTTNVERSLALTTDYTVTGAGEVSGGSITLTAGNLATGIILTIRRVLPITQEADIRNQGDFFPEAHENEFDKLTMIEQQLSEELSGAVKLPETILPSAFNTSLPPDIVGASSKAITTNPAGTGFDLAANWPSAAAIASAAGYAAAAQAAAAAAQAAGGSVVLWLSVNYKVFADSPISVLSSNRGQAYHVDATGGNVIVRLPQLSGLSLVTPYSVTIFKSDSSANTVTVQAYNAGDGTNKINGANTIVLSNQFSSAICIASTAASPNEWTAILGISTSVIADGSITTAKLAANAVTTAKTNDSVTVFQGTAAAGSDNLTAGSWTSFTLAAAAFTAGTGWSRSTNDLTPASTGLYRARVRMAGVAFSLTLNQSIGVRIRDTTASTTSGTDNYPLDTLGAPCDFFVDFRVANASHTYQVQYFALTGGAGGATNTNTAVGTETPPRWSIEIFKLGD